MVKFVQIPILWLVKTRFFILFELIMGVFAPTWGADSPFHMQSFFSDSLPHKGDTLNYTIHIARKSEKPILLVVQNDVFPSQFELIRSSVQQSKEANSQGVWAITEFRYQILATDTGKAEIQPFDFHTIGSAETQTLQSPATQIQISKERVAHRVLLFWIGFLIVLLPGAWFIIRRTKKKLKAKEPTPDWKDELHQLDMRLKSANSKNWLLSLRNLFNTWFIHQGYLAGKPEEQIDLFLNQNTSINMATSDDWKHLQKEFRHALYGGGKREPHQNRETLKTAYRCLGIPREDEE